MAIIKCKMCGGDLELVPDSTVCECEYCGTRQTVPEADDEKKLKLFERANRLRRACEFDKAAGVYESIVADFDTEAEAYWGLVLCKFGIEYVDDPATGKKVPTCHRAGFESVEDDVNFEQACENADAVARRVYREEGRAIDELRERIIEVSGREEPYDIFISYKELAEDGERTEDSVLAQDIYDALTAKGYRVFFSRVTLEDKLGVEYEPYIFAALQSAKVMLLVGMDYENLNAVWVRNEWSRYLALMAQHKEKVLIPCYKNMDAYDLPKEVRKLAAQDMGKVGAMQDLLRGVGKIIPGSNVQSAIEHAGPSTFTPSPNNAINPLLERAFMFLEDGNWKSAVEYCEKVLDLDPKNANAYAGKLMAELHVRQIGDLSAEEHPFDGNDNYQKAIRFADDGLREILDKALTVINERNEQSRLDGLYKEAISKMGTAVSEADYLKAAELFNAISKWKDSSEKAEKCREKAETARKNAIYSKAKQLMNSSSESSIRSAIPLFQSIPGWKDADELIKKCPNLAETARKNELFREALNAGEKDSIESLQFAVSTLSELGDWQNAPVKLKAYEIRLEKLRTNEANYQAYLRKYPEKRNEEKYKKDLSVAKEKMARAYQEQPTISGFECILLILCGIGSINIVFGLMGEGITYLLLGLLALGMFALILYAQYNSKKKWKQAYALKSLEASIQELEQKLETIKAYPEFDEAVRYDE